MRNDIVNSDDNRQDKACIRLVGDKESFDNKNKE